MGDAGGPTHEDAIPLRMVRFPHNVEKLLDVARSLLQSSGHHHRHDGGLPVLRYQRLVAGLVIVLCDCYDFGAEGCNAGEQGFHGFPERGIIHGQRVRLHDDDFGNGLRAAAQATLEQFCGPLGVHASAEAQFRRGGAVQHAAAEQNPNDHQDNPQGNDQPRAAGADAGQCFGHSYP